MLLKCLIPFLLLGSIIYGENYELAIGEKDKERLDILNEIYNPFTEDFTRQLIVPGNEVLELGCGIGLVSQKLAALVGNEGSVLATDLNEEQLIIARSILPTSAPKNLSFQQCSARDLTTLNKKFDVVYVRFLLVHLENVREILQQVKTVLRPGGKFIIEDLTGNHTLYSDPDVEGMRILQYIDQLQFIAQQSDDQYFSKLPQILKEEGFHIQSLKYSHPKLDTLRNRKMLSYHLPSLKDALFQAQLLTQKEYDQMEGPVEQLVNDLSIEIFSYQLGQICAEILE